MSTNIEWTHPPGFEGETWNPTLGCDKISAGCKNCYAIDSAWRWGHHTNEKIKSAYEGLVVKQENGDLNWTGRINMLDERLQIPLKRRKPTCWFVNSMSDLFHEDIPDEFIWKIFGVMARTPQHIYQILTKREERMQKFMSQRDFHQRLHEEVKAQMGYDHPDRPAINERDVPLKNVWMGVSVEDQDSLGKRAWFLLLTPAAVRFISYEPALGPIELDLAYPNPKYIMADAAYSPLHGFTHPRTKEKLKIDWVIAGGESGHGARPAHPDWYRTVRDQCVAAGVPFFFKQWGSNVPGEIVHKDEPGDNPIDKQLFRRFQNGHEFWLSNDLTIEPLLEKTTYRSVGKNKAGRLLDGKEWLQFPEVTR